MAAQQVKGKMLKKQWYPIRATKAFDSTFLGESYVAAPSMLLNRNLTLNLANLTGDIKQQGINLKFLISEVSEDDAGIANVISYEASPSQLRRLVRRGVEILNDSITCTTADNKQVRVKPFAVTKTQTSKRKLTMMRAYLRKALNDEVGRHSFDDLIRSVVGNKLQVSLKGGVKKIYPVRALEIKKLEMLQPGKHPKDSEKAADKPDSEGVEEQSSAEPEKIGETDVQDAEKDDAPAEDDSTGK